MTCEKRIDAMMNRRHFLWQSGVLAVAASACGGLRYARSTIVGNAIHLDRSAISSTGVLVEAAEGQLPVFVRVTDTEAIRAFSTRCMHRGCQVEAIAERFVCPCHGSEYAADGAVLKGPTELPLIEYRVSADGSNVRIHLDETVLRERHL